MEPRSAFLIWGLLFLAGCSSLYTHNSVVAGKSSGTYEEQRQANDTDNDGIINQLDRCPETGQGIPVDIYGCPSDRDQDGVSDYLDDCPETPQGAEVDLRGCPRDSDGDGVIDMLDACLETPPDVKVDARGCPVVVPVATPVEQAEEPEPLASLELRITFFTGSASLRSDFSDEFVRGAEFIRAYPGSRVTIEGHTDSVGTEEWNMKLSLERANVVREKLLSTLKVNIPIEVSAYGETRPVTGNDTQEGRMKNRRVIIRIDPPRGG